MSRYQITGIIYIHIDINVRARERGGGDRKRQTERERTVSKATLGKLLKDGVERIKHGLYRAPRYHLGLN